MNVVYCHETPISFQPVMLLLLYLFMLLSLVIKLKLHLLLTEKIK